MLAMAAVGIRIRRLVHVAEMNADAREAAIKIEMRKMAAEIPLSGCERCNEGDFPPWYGVPHSPALLEPRPDFRKRLPSGDRPTRLSGSKRTGDAP
jgi:hypothetical protein